MFQLQRYEKNPILKPIKKHSWESKMVFNTAAVFKNDKVYLIYRARGEDKTEGGILISRLGLCVLKNDGVTIEKRCSYPVLKPEEWHEPAGCEDPRITGINGQYYLLYTAYLGHKTPPFFYLSSNQFQRLYHLRPVGSRIPYRLCFLSGYGFWHRLHGPQLLSYWQQNTYTFEKAKLHYPFRLHCGSLQLPIIEKTLFHNYAPLHPSLYCNTDGCQRKITTLSYRPAIPDGRHAYFRFHYSLCSPGRYAFNCLDGSDPGFDAGAFYSGCIPDYLRKDRRLCSSSPGDKQPVSLPSIPARPGWFYDYRCLDKLPCSVVLC